MNSKPLLIGFFLAVVVITAASIYISRSVDKPDKTVTSVASPDGKYKAVRVTVARGGTQPFCVDTIAVFLSVYPDSFADSDTNYEIYAERCAAPADRATLPKIEWLARDTLRITVPPEAAGAGVPRKDLDASLFVHVSYAAAH